MDNDKIYNDIIKETQRLEFNESLQRIAIDYIYKQLSDKEALILFNQNLPDFNIQILNHKLIYDATLNALYVMKDSKSKTEFEYKIQKYIAKNDNINFNEILKDLLQIKP